MTEKRIEIRIHGKSFMVPWTSVANRTVIATGKGMRLAAVMDEQLVEGETVPDPESFVLQLKNTGLKADIFTFAQKVPDLTPRYNYHLEWDNAAVIPISTFVNWWEKRAGYDVRKNVRRAKKLGVVCQLAEFNDEFVEGIRRIYNESPVRQGTAFWHYQKDFDTVKRENATYIDRSAFIGAYYERELIGFIKMVYIGTVASTLQVISQKRHSDKKPTNALIATAIEICTQKEMSHFVYGSYDYGNPDSSLTEFKRRNGFEQALIPRYYVPLTVKGKMALKLGLHHGLTERIPEPVVTNLRKIRNLWYKRKLETATEGL